MMLLGDIKVRCGSRRGVTLIELLVVISIIALLASIGVPAVRGLTRTSSVGIATRQLADALAIARSRAIAERTTVFLLFAPTNFTNIDLSPANYAPGPRGELLARRDAATLESLRGTRYRAYAMFAESGIGDQPGPLGANARYLSEWEVLPENNFIAVREFAVLDDDVDTWELAWASETSSAIPPDHRPLPYASFPFPSAASPRIDLPYVAFNHRGQLVHPRYFNYPIPTEPRDIVIHLAKGSIFYDRDANGVLTDADPDVLEVPVNNSVESFNRVRIDWLTGRARVETPTLQD